MRIPPHAGLPEVSTQQRAKLFRLFSGQQPSAFQAVPSDSVAHFVFDGLNFALFGMLFFAMAMLDFKRVERLLLEGLWNKRC